MNEMLPYKQYSILRCIYIVVQDNVRDRLQRCEPNNTADPHFLGKDCLCVRC